MNVDLIFENLYQKLSQLDFGSSLGGELPLYIQPLPPDKQMESEKEIMRLASRLEKIGIKTATVNLFDLAINILREEDLLDTILEEERNINKSDMIATLDSVLDIQDVLLPRIKDIIQQNNPKYLFISGVGSVYPFIRSHGILNNIDVLTEEKGQTDEEKCRLVLFFPGEYDRLQLKLFCHIWDENYYRGLNLNEISI